jgi:nitrous oxidase accessory protein NosD
MRPPVVHLAAGVHKGPLVIDRRETLVGEQGAVVRGGIIVRADDVTIRNVAVVGGENGIEVDEARNVVLDRVSVSGAQLDGIHVRRSNVEIRDCTIDSAPTRGLRESISRSPTTCRRAW